MLQLQTTAQLVFTCEASTIAEAHVPCYRARVEREVEQLYRQRLEHNCYLERSNQQKLYNWGQRERAKNYLLPHCDKLRGLYGLYT